MWQAHVHKVISHYVNIAAEVLVCIESLRRYYRSLLLFTLKTKCKKPLHRYRTSSLQQPGLPVYGSVGSLRRYYQSLLLFTLNTKCKKPLHRYRTSSLQQPGLPVYGSVGSLRRYYRSLLLFTVNTKCKKPLHMQVSHIIFAAAGPACLRECRIPPQVLSVPILYFEYEV